MEEKVRKIAQEFKNGDIKNRFLFLFVIPASIIFWIYIRDWKFVPIEVYTYSNYIYNIVFYILLTCIMSIKILFSFHHLAQANMITAYCPVDREKTGKRRVLLERINNEIYEGIVGLFIKTTTFAGFSLFMTRPRVFTIIVNPYIVFGVLVVSLVAPMKVIRWVYYTEKDLKLRVYDEGTYFLKMVGSEKIDAPMYCRTVEGPDHLKVLLANNQTEIEKALNTYDLDKIIPFFCQLRDSWVFNKDSEFNFKNPHRRSEREV